MSYHDTNEGGSKIHLAIQRWRKATGLTYRQIAALVKISESHARKMGCGAIARCSAQLAERFEHESHGIINAEEMVFPGRFQNGNRKRGAS